MCLKWAIANDLTVNQMRDCIDQSFSKYAAKSAKPARPIEVFRRWGPPRTPI